MPLASGGTAPYAPPATVLAAIKAYRDRGLTTPITPDVLARASIPETLTGRTLRSLISLDLIDEQGKPTPEFEALKKVPSGEYKGKLEALVKSVYAEVFRFTDPATDPAEKVTDAFRAYVPDGQRSRMVTLFLGLCEAAGIVPEGTSTKRATMGAGSPVAAKPRKASFRGPAGTRVSGGEIHASDGAIPPGLVAILAMLPKNGAGWPQARRNQFMTLFGHAVDFAIPIRDKEPLGPGDADEDIDE